MSASTPFPASCARPGRCVAACALAAANPFQTAQCCCTHLGFGKGQLRSCAAPSPFSAPWHCVRAVALRQGRPMMRSSLRHAPARFRFMIGAAVTMSQPA